MNILIVGAGAVGGYFGAKLVQADRDVGFLVRERRAAQLAEHGLRVRSPEGAVETVRPTTLTSAAITAPYDVVLLAVKSYALDQAMADIAPAVGDDTTIIPLLNGMRHIDQLVARYGVHRVYGGVCLVATTLADNGDIVQLTGLQKLSWGPLDGIPTPRLERVSGLLTGAGFEAEASQTILLDMWEKWVVLASIGAITCLMRGSLGEINAAPGGGEFASGVLDEAAATATAAGYPPREQFLARARATVTQPGSIATSSMYRDLTAGRPVEVEQILGDLVTRAARLGVRAPLLGLAYTNLRVYSARLEAAR